MRESYLYHILHNMDKIRLQKFMSEQGLLSRRSAEAEISAGRVSINGIVATLGDKVDPTVDEVVWAGRRIAPIAEGEERGHTYILLNKPVDYVTTLSDEKGRRTIAELISDVGTRLYPVGRLDRYSCGLLLCTDDGELTNRITHPSHDIPKTYVGILTSRLDDDDIARLSVPFELDGYLLRPFEVRRLGYKRINNADATVVEFVLHEGRNREIRNICAHHGYRLASLMRVAIGDLRLGTLQSGKWRHLTEDEVAYLKSC